MYRDSACSCVNPANGCVSTLGGATMEVVAPCAGTPNARCRARLKCNRRLFGTIQVTHQLPASAADFNRTPRKDMRCHARRLRRLSTFPYENASWTWFSAPARRPKVEVRQLTVTRPLTPPRTCAWTGWERSRTPQRSHGVLGSGST